MNKILVVDDDTDMLFLVNLMLTYNDYSVKTISQWEIIPESVKNFNPDLILLDINLDGANGGDICKELKKSIETQHLPVILFSSHISEVYCKSCDAQGCLNKPFATSDLLELIKLNLNEHHAVA